MKKQKLTKEEKQQFKREDRAWIEMIQRAKIKQALVSETDWKPLNPQS